MVLDFSINNPSIKSELDTGDDLYVEGCDITQVKVISNHAPHAKIYYGQSRRGITLMSFHASRSSDPDGNSLSYSWGRNGTVGSSFSNSSSYSLPHGAFNTLVRSGALRSIILTVTDGDKTDTTTLDVTNI
jgi:hypothetical protein